MSHAYIYICVCVYINIQNYTYTCINQIYMQIHCESLSKKTFGDDGEIILIFDQVWSIKVVLSNVVMQENYHCHPVYRHPLGPGHQNHVFVMLHINSVHSPVLRLTIPGQSGLHLTIKQENSLHDLSTWCEYKPGHFLHKNHLKTWIKWTSNQPPGWYRKVRTKVPQFITCLPTRSLLQKIFREFPNWI